MNVIPLTLLEGELKMFKEKLSSQNIIEILFDQISKIKEWRTNLENVLFQITEELNKKVERYHHYFHLLDKSCDYFITNVNDLNEILQYKKQYLKEVDTTKETLHQLDSFFTTQLELLNYHPLSEIFQQQLLQEQEQSEVDSGNKKNLNDFSNSIRQVEQNLNLKDENLNGSQKDDVQNGKPHEKVVEKFEKDIQQEQNLNILALGRKLKRPTYLIDLPCKMRNTKDNLEMDQDTGMEQQQEKKEEKHICIFWFNLSFDGQFENGKRIGPGTETTTEKIEQQDDDPIDLSASIFKKATNKKKFIERKTVLKGKYQNDLKEDEFQKLIYENEKLTNQFLQVYKKGNLEWEYPCE